MDESGESSRKGDLESEILKRVEEAISIVNCANHVDQVICALHSLAILLFPIDSSLISGAIDQRRRNQVLDAGISLHVERDAWRVVFYQGSAFPILAKVLLYDIASNWLGCFPFSARRHVYDSFFVSGPPIETIQAIVPALHNGTIGRVDFLPICSNAERLLILCLLENEGVRCMTRDLGESFTCRNYATESLIRGNLTLVSRLAQIVASVPDKASPEASIGLSSHHFFKKVIIQLLAGVEERSVKLFIDKDLFEKTPMDGSFLFAGEMFARISRRGFADILIAEAIPWILEHIRSCLSLENQSIGPELLKSRPQSLFWLRIIEAIKDPYAIERFLEELLRQLAAKDVNDTEAYWILWVLFHRSLEHQIEIRGMFVSKFIQRKVFPICCLRWILQFPLLKCSHLSNNSAEHGDTTELLDTMQHLVSIWSKREFVQSTSMEQQAYVTAAIGLSLEKVSKEELEGTQDILHSLLEGVSCRLESPIDLVRKMASSVALVFSKIVDPQNPLYLNEDCNKEKIDWEFGLTTLQGKKPADSLSSEMHTNGSKAPQHMLERANIAADYGLVKDPKSKMSETDRDLPGFKFVDPDEIVDPATLNCEKFSNEEKDSDESDSESSRDSSLQPYDLSDDDADLERKVTQLNDIIIALRKPDDPDGVERALSVAEKFIRASPDELQHVSHDLANVLVYIKCSHVTVEGEEDSAEEKRHKALVSLLVTCPFESLDSLNKLLYSPNVDVSQRILILDVMTDAAQELANAKIVKMRRQRRDLISTISESQPWYLPKTRGPLGATEWKEVSETGNVSCYSRIYERELPYKPGRVRSGKSRRWSLRLTNTLESRGESSTNNFPIYAASFMLPAMQGFDKKRHGVDLLGMDFIILGKLIYMLGVCMRCMAMHPEASALAPALLDFISSRGIAHHAETYVRRSVLFTASCILQALHPSYVGSALVEGNQDVSRGLEWMRTWALNIAETDLDTDCSTMAMTCLQLHAEMALQASRSLESSDHFLTRSGGLSSISSQGTVKIPQASAVSVSRNHF